ncbi:MAG: PD-(D/E)XK nuclease family transposase [Planctomycetota bacterium]
MAQRLTHYTSRSCVDQPKKGQDDSKLRPSICICILADPLFSNPPALHPDFRLRDQSCGVTLTGDLQIHFLQLSHLQVTTETLYDASEKEGWLFCSPGSSQADRMHRTPIRRGSGRFTTHRWRLSPDRRKGSRSCFAERLWPQVACHFSGLRSFPFPCLLR